MSAERKILKCGRVTYDLVDEDAVMDNGYCLQFITRSLPGINGGHPRVSKKEFIRFKEMVEVNIDHDHAYNTTTELWIFNT